MNNLDELGTNVTLGLCIKNSEKTIKDCIESILNQDYPENLVEIIVVDGKSQDGTIDIAKKLISSSNVSSKFLCDGGKGIATARQMVLDASSNSYVIFVDGDVLLSSNFIKSQVRFMQNNPKVGVAIGRFYYQKSVQKTLPATLQGLFKHVDTLEWVKRKNPSGFPSNDASIYSVQATRQIGGFDKNIAGASEDEDIITRFKMRGWMIAVNVNAMFYALSRETWQALWKENMWFGYGKHFLNHKYNRKHFFLYNFPLLSVYVGFRESLKCYKLTLLKKSFLLPMVGFFDATALNFGFIKAHYEGYGHETKI